MTAPDGSRLHRLDRGLWLDLDEIVAVETMVGQLQERRVRLTLANGIAHDIVIGAKPGTGNPRTDEEKDDELAAWLLEHLADVLEGVEHPPPTAEEVAAMIGLDLGKDRR